MSNKKINLSKPDDKFKTIQTIHLEGNSVTVEFPVPPKLEPYVRFTSYIDLAIEYYILARFGYFHKMERSYMINAFWTVEYLLLSILTSEYKDVEALKKEMNLHKITQYWKKIKSLHSNPEVIEALSQFDNFIGNIQGYYNERYLKDISRLKLTYTGKIPKVTVPIDSSGKEKSVRFMKVRPLNIDEFDHFVNFMLHDIRLKIDLQTKLLRFDATDIYKKDNKFSIIYPDKRYSGELNKNS